MDAGYAWTLLRVGYFPPSKVSLRVKNNNHKTPKKSKKSLRVEKFSKILSPEGPFLPQFSHSKGRFSEVLSAHTRHFPTLVPPGRKSKCKNSLFQGFVKKIVFFYVIYYQQLSTNTLAFFYGIGPSSFISVYHITLSAV